MKQIIISTCLCCFTITAIQAQIFNKLKNRVTQKIEQKVEDKIVEELSERIANAAVKPIDAAIEEAFREQYKAENGEEYDDSQYATPEERQNAMNSIMAGWFGNVSLPASYSFQHKVDIETFDYGSKESNFMTMLVSTEAEIFGMEQENKGKKQWIVFDFNNDLMAIYDLDKNTVMAMANVMKIAKGFAVAADSEIQEEMKDFKFEKMSKTKNILSCNSQGYKTESKSYKSEFYVCDNLPFSWTDNFGKFVQNMAPNYYRKNPEYEVIKGMMMEAKTQRKEDKKESRWETKKITSEDTVIDNSKFENAFTAQN